MKLSPHFTLSEATKSQTALRKGIDNFAPSDVVPVLVNVAEQVLEPVREQFGIPFSPNSWYRCPDLNSAIGSKPSSHHVSGRAVDFEIPGISNAALAKWCTDNLSFDQLLLEFHDPADPASGWVHCSIPRDGEKGRGEILTITREGVIEGLPTND